MLNKISSIYSLFLLLLIIIITSPSRGHVILPIAMTRRRILDYEDCTVYICAYGDNAIGLNISTDAGETWSHKKSESLWSTPLRFTYNGTLNEDTRIKFTVQDRGYVSLCSPIYIICMFLHISIYTNIK